MSLWALTSSCRSSLWPYSWTQRRFGCRNWWTLTSWCPRVNDSKPSVSHLIFNGVLSSIVADFSELCRRFAAGVTSGFTSAFFSQPAVLLVEGTACSYITGKFFIWWPLRLGLLWVGRLKLSCLDWWHNVWVSLLIATLIGEWQKYRIRTRAKKTTPA